jgi:ribosomal protein S18 acetylase RimI-like enzyme
MVQLIPIEENDYQAWLKAGIEEYAAEKVKAGFWTPSEGLQRSREEFDHLLPDGRAAPRSWIYSIVNERAEKVGVIWYKPLSDAADNRTAYIYDLIVFEPFRRQGYAAQAMRRLEDFARQEGFVSMALNVFGHNQGAIDLYRKLGYSVTSMNMAKPISP